MKEVKNMKDEKNINKILKEERIRAGISIRNLAKLAGVSPTTICEIEKDRGTKNTFSTIAKIAKVLDLNLNYLADGINNNEETENNNYIVNIRRIDENCLEFESDNKDLLLDFLKDISYDTDAIDLKIGEEIKLNIKSILSEDDQEDYYYCPYCNAELN